MALFPISSKTFCLRARIVIPAFLACLMAVFPGPLHMAAQTGSTGAISGIVSDPSGAAIPSVLVRLSCQSTDLVRELFSNGVGVYRANFLTPGLYSLRVERSGFETVILDPVIVRVTQELTLDIRMRVAAAESQTVIVRPGRGINASSSTVGEVIEHSAIKVLPLPTLNFQQLLALSPGTSAGISNNTDLGRGDAYISVNGQRMTSNNMMINGTEVIGAGTNSTLNSPVPAPDTIEQFIVQTSLFNATSGRNSGGNTAVITKSGTNELHGTVYEFLRNRGLNANDFFLNGQGRDRPILNRNQFGGTLGGPVSKEKAFYFISYQGTRERNGTSLTNSMTSPNIPAGLTQDRSAGALTSLAHSFGVDTINPVALALLQTKLPNGQYAMPSAGRADPDPTALIPTPLNGISRYQEDQSNTNIDMEIRGNDRLAVKFFFSGVEQYQAIYNFLGANPFQAPGYGGFLDYRNWLLTVSDTHAFGPRLVNQVTYGFNRTAGRFAPEEPFSNAQFGIRNPLAAEYPGLATIGVTGLFTIGSTPVADGNSAGRTHNLSDHLSWSRGRQNMTLGGQIRHTALGVDLKSYSRGSVSFNNFSDFLRGVTSVALLGNGIRDREMRTTDIVVFFQDDIRLTDRFTLNAGIRFEHYGGISEIENRFSRFDPVAFSRNDLPCTVTSPCNPPAGIALLSPEQTLNPDTEHFAPRFGFAWSPLSNDRFVARGGFGVYFDKFSMRLGSQQTLNYPYDVIGTGLAGPFFSDPFPDLAGIEFPVIPAIPSPIPYYAGGVPFANLPTPISGVFVDRNLRTPYVYVYQAGIEWELTDDYFAEIDYIGNKGTKLINVTTLNQGIGVTAPYTASGFSRNKILNGFQMIETTAVSHYDSLQTGLRRHSASVGFSLSYTFSKSIDEYSGTPTNELAALPGDQQDRRSQRGVSDFDRTHRFVASFLYGPKDLYQGNLSVARGILNGWQVSGIVTVQSGVPFSVISTSGATVYNRADLVRAGNGEKTGPVKSRLDAYFDSTAFELSMATAPPFGTSSRNILRGPGQKSIDLSIGRSFRTNGSGGLEFRTEFFNLFNFVNFSIPNNNIHVPGTVARITSTSTGPRVVQCAVKYSF